MTQLNIASEGRVATTAAQDQDDSVVATLADGSYVIAWHGEGAGDVGGIFMQHYDALGHKIGGETLVNAVETDNTQNHPDIAALADGGWVIVWAGNVPNDTAGIFYQSYSSTGVAQLSGQASIVTGPVQDHPAVSAMVGGGFVVSWESLNEVSGTSGNDIYFQTFKPTGDRGSALIPVNATTANGQHDSDIATLSDGSLVVIWTSDYASDGADIRFRHFSATGTPLTAESSLRSGLHHDTESYVTALDDGGYVISWSGTATDGLAGNMFQRFDANDVQMGDAAVLVDATTAIAQAPAIAELSDGGLIAAYTVAGAGNNGDVVAQRFDDAGNAIGALLHVNTYTTDVQDRAQVAAVADGGFVVAWTSLYEDGQGAGVFQRTYTNAPTQTGNQLLYGTSGADILDGGSGNDTMYGGVGDDVYVVNATGDIVGEAAGQGTDTVQALISYVLGEDVENLTLIGTAALSGTGNGFDNILTGNSGANVLYGSLGNDQLDGAAGNDTLYGEDNDDSVQGGAGNDVLFGGEGDDDILGGDGRDSLLGNAGNDNLDGGAGDDTLTDTGGNNTLIGGAGQDYITGGMDADMIYAGDQNDLVYASTGVDHDYGDSGTDTYNAATVNVAAVVDLTMGKATQGSGNVAWLSGFENIIGTEHDDILTGDGNDNDITGAGGADTMSGGLGNDTYHVDNTSDVVIESSNGALGGHDTIQSTVDYTLANFAEDLILTDSAVTGNGEGHGNTITGNVNDNLIDGKAGNDTMIGGLGNDTYWVDTAGDVVVEKPGEGIDTVRAAITYTLGANLENLVLTGTGNLNGTGNAAVNSLTGNAGNNTLDGNAGADILTGGTGNDVYFVDNTGDNVVEADGAGTDTVYSSVTYTLSGRFIETLALTGSSNINAIGNSKANILVSNAGNNSLIGGGGADTFVFGLNSHADTITDFTSSQGDSIDVSAYHAVSHTVTLSGTSVIIDFGSGNTVTVLHATVADVTAHTVF